MAWASFRSRRVDRVPAMTGTSCLAALPCQVRGFVVRGDGRGQVLGYPTANMALAGHPDLPPDGVFAGEYRRPDGSRHSAMISLGCRPTFYLGAGARILEAHLLDFSDDLYGEAAVVEFRHWIRDQRRFGSLEELAGQIERDAHAVRLRVGPREADGRGGTDHRVYESLVRSSAVIQPSSEAIRIPAPGMCKGSITSRSASQNGPYPAA